MGSTSQNLLLEEPTPGDPSARNTWGTTLNTNFTLIDSAVAGILSLSVAGGSNVVLTSSAGAPDQARNAHFEFTGALTADIDVLWPAGLERQFTVSNQTTGSFTLTIGANNGSSAPAGTTVTVPQGSSMNLTSDGTNVSERVSYTTFASTPAAAAATVVANLALQTQTGGSTYAADTSGTANTITASLTPAIASYAAGMSVQVKVANANTGPATINLNSLGAKNIYRQTENQGVVALVGGELLENGLYWLIYDGTQFQLQGRQDVVGRIIDHGGATAPSAGYLLCYGQAISRSTYAALFAAIGTTWGTGDGSTTFNLPDLRGRVTAGLDNMGGTAANRLTSASGTPGTTLGGTGGGELQQQHNHAASSTSSSSSSGSIGIQGANNAGGTGTTFMQPGGSTSVSISTSTTTTTTISDTGSGTTQNVQPVAMVNRYIKA